MDLPRERESESPNRAPAERADRLGFQLGRVHRLVRTAWERELADLGLTAPQAAVLRTLSRDSATGIRELSRRLEMDPMNAKRVVDLLEERGLLRSRSDTAHRQRRVVETTNEGETLARVIRARADAWDAELVAMIGADDTATLLTLLSRLERNVRLRADSSIAGEAHT